MTKPKKLPMGIKPLLECRTLVEVMTNVSHLCQELNQIKGVTASYSVNSSNGESKKEGDR